MDRTNYQYAAAADLCCRRREGAPLAGKLLVLDLDHCAAGLCSCTGRGGVTQMAELQSQGEPTFFSALAAARGGTAEGWMERWMAQQQNTERAVVNYLRSRRAMDPVLLNANGPLPCSQAEQMFAPTAALLGRFLEELDRMLAGQQLDLNALRILMIGRYARVFWAEAAIRIHFGGSAVMPDPRFAPHRAELPPESYVERGRALYEAGQVEEAALFGHEVGLALQEQLSTGKLRRRSGLLAGPQQTLEELKKPDFSCLFYAERGKALQLVVDGRAQSLPLPFEPKGMLRAALMIEKDGQAVLALADEGNTGARAQKIPVSIAKKREKGR